MILAGLAYRDVGQPRFFLFSRKRRDCRFRLHKGRKPRLSLRSRDNSVREPNAQPAPATGLFTGFGVRPQRAKMDFQRSRWKSILSICGNKCTARQVGIPAAKTQHLRKTLVYLQRTCYNKIEVDHYEQYWKLLKTDSK